MDGAPPPDDGELQRKQYLLARLAELEEQERLQRELPHKYGWKWYGWALDFHNARETYAFLCAGNQISKSSSQIRTAIEWATNKALWPTLWKTRPHQFWYLYPTLEVATVEFDEKWEPEFMPRGSMKDHPDYGWSIVRGTKGLIKAIHFNSGVSIYFKSYATNVMALQTSSAHAIFCDEELPEELYPEINMRIQATDGYFRMVFTATIGQEFWRRVIEEKGTEMELMPQAWKRQVSMYDCLSYADGTPAPWTAEKIKRVEQSLPTQNEIDRRVYGRFVKSEGLMYPAFTPKLYPLGNIEREPEGVIPFGWKVYAGVDIGSGNAGTRTGHPAAIVFIAVNPEYTFGRIIRLWRGDKIQTTAADVYEKYRELKGDWPIEVFSYDHQSADFRTIAERAGDSPVPAQKGEQGVSMLNSLFKNKSLTVPDTTEGLKLQSELRALDVDTDKSHAKDDLCDATRFAAGAVPWDFEKILDRSLKAAPKQELSEAEFRKAYEEKMRRGETVDELFDPDSGRTFTGMEDVEWEIKEFNDLLDPNA